MGAFEALTISSHRLCRWYLTDIPAAQEVPVDVSFCAGACWSAIDLLKRMSEDLS